MRCGWELYEDGWSWTQEFGVLFRQKETIWWHIYDIYWENMMPKCVDSGCGLISFIGVTWKRMSLWASIGRWRGLQPYQITPKSLRVCTFLRQLWETFRSDLGVHKPGTKYYLSIEFKKKCLNIINLLFAFQTHISFMFFYIRVLSLLLFLLYWI